MKKLGEKGASVKCRQVDLVLVKEILEPARKNFTALFQEEAPVLTLDQSSFLPPPPQGTAADDHLSRWVARCLSDSLKEVGIMVHGAGNAGFTALGCMTVCN